jgi:hypothetical protein
MTVKGRKTGANRGLNAMGAEVVNSTFVLLLNFCDLLNICASNPPLRQAPNRCAACFGDIATFNKPYNFIVLTTWKKKQ